MKRGTARIFMGPKADEAGKSIPFREQRRLLIELDKFTVNCKFWDEFSFDAIPHKKLPQLLQ